MIIQLFQKYIPVLLEAQYTTSRAQRLTGCSRFAGSTPLRPSAHFCLREYAPAKTSATPGTLAAIVQEKKFGKGTYGNSELDCRKQEVIEIAKTVIRIVGSRDFVQRLGTFQSIVSRKIIAGFYSHFHIFGSKIIPQNDSVQLHLHRPLTFFWELQ